jgi:hypothetical protein
MCGQFECEPFDCVVDVVFVFEDFEPLPPAASATPTPVPPSAIAAVTAATATLRLGRNT